MESRAAAINNIVTGLLNCDKKRIKAEEAEFALNVFSPYR